jgi:GT2 family glycosyltransferase
MPPYYSLIVLAYNNWNFTEMCLISLLNNLEENQLVSGVEIILVDNGSNMEAKQQMNTFHKNHNHSNVTLRIVSLKENLGYPSGINCGLAHSNGQIMAVLNNDLIFPPNWFSPIVDLLESDRSVGFAAPFLSYAGSSVQNVGKTFDTLVEMVAFAAYFTHLNKAQMIYTNQVIGACLIFRRDLLNAIGGNDFWYGIGNFDDVDWCIRSRLAGYKIAVVGGSFVHHIGHASFLQAPEQFNSSLENNQTKFERKWRIKEQHALKFERDKHYIPIQISDFAVTDKSLFPRTSSVKRLLLCADWSTPFSEWGRVFTSLLAESGPIELFCWVPAAIYDTKAISAQFQQMMAAQAQSTSNLSNTLIVIHQEVPYSDTLSLLRSVDEVVRIPEDFVNRYIIYLAEQIDLKII